MLGTHIGKHIGNMLGTHLGTHVIGKHIGNTHWDTYWEHIGNKYVWEAYWEHILGNILGTYWEIGDTYYWEADWEHILGNILGTYWEHILVGSILGTHIRKPIGTILYLGWLLVCMCSGKVRRGPRAQDPAHQPDAENGPRAWH